LNNAGQYQEPKTAITKTAKECGKHQASHRARQAPVIMKDGSTGCIIERAVCFHLASWPMGVCVGYQQLFPAFSQVFPRI
jgi:hypothetical protein